MPGKLRNIIKSTCQTGKRWVAYVWDNRIVLIAGVTGLPYTAHFDKDKVLSGAGVESLQHFIDYLMGVTVPVEMSGLRFTGLIRLCFMPLLPMMPGYHPVEALLFPKFQIVIGGLAGFGALTVAVASEPFIVDFTLKVLGGDVACLPGLHEALEEIVTRAITKSLVWPNRVVVRVARNPACNLF
eukprot:gene3026-3846_t